MYSNVIVCLALLPLIHGFVGPDGSHIGPGHKCDLCDCFVDYKDRDIWSPLEPYAVAAVGWETTLDQCLALCLRDARQCAAVVYGYVGGRDIISCELYKSVDLPGGVRYVYGLHTLIRRTAMPCLLNFDNVKQVDVTAPSEFVVQRKRAYQRLYRQKNPFYWGRK